MRRFSVLCSRDVRIGMTKVVAMTKSLNLMSFYVLLREIMPSKEGGHTSFLRVLQRECDVPSLLTKIRDADKEAAEHGKLCADLEEELLAKASALLLGKDSTLEDIKAFLASDKFKDIETRRSAIGDIRSQTVKEALDGYDMLDANINKLDDDMTTIDRSVKVDHTPLPGQRRKYSRQGAEPVEVDIKAAQEEAAAPGVSEDLPVDPNEPLYCTCKKVSFGQMVGCDNEDCPIEWFHFQCVGLTQQPKGKWFCPICTAAQKGSEE